MVVAGGGGFLPRRGPAAQFRGSSGVYGPFRYAGRYTSESNAAFDRYLQERDPLSGIRDFEAVDALAQKEGLELDERSRHARQQPNRGLAATLDRTSLRPDEPGSRPIMSPLSRILLGHIACLARGKPRRMLGVAALRSGCRRLKAAARTHPRTLRAVHLSAQLHRRGARRAGTQAARRTRWAPDCCENGLVVVAVAGG